MSDTEVYEARKNLPITKSWIYLDNAGAGPLPASTVESVHKFLLEWSQNGEPWEAGLETIIEAKKKFSQLIGARSPDYMATMVNATSALNKVMMALVTAHRQSRANIVIDSYGFPTNYYTLLALKRKGFLNEIRYIKSVHSEEKLTETQELIDNNTLAVIVDHVSWKTGVRTNLREISKLAHDNGALLVTDAFHSVGSLPVNVSELGADVLYFGSYKWLLSPHGAALMYVSQRVINMLEPPCIGWFSIRDSIIERYKRKEPMFQRPIPIDVFDYSQTADRFEDGTQALHAYVGLLASYNFMEAFGWNKIYERVLSLSRMLRESLDGYASEIYEDEESGITVVSTLESIKIARLLEKTSKIKISARPGFLRLSPHFYNTEEEVEKVAESLKTQLKRLA